MAHVRSSFRFRSDVLFWLAIASLVAGSGADATSSADSTTQKFNFRFLSDDLHLSGMVPPSTGSSPIATMAEVNVSFWRAYIDIPARIGGAFALLLLLGFLFPDVYKNPKMISGLQLSLGLADIVMGITFCFVAEKWFKLLNAREPIFWGCVFQVISGLYRVIVEIVALLRGPEDSKGCMGAWFVPFSLSLMSPFAFAAGLPSVVLVVIWCYKVKEGAGAWKRERSWDQNQNQYQNLNQVIQTSPSAGGATLHRESRHEPGTGPALAPAPATFSRPNANVNAIQSKQ